MKRFENKVLHIKSEEMLEEVSKLITDKGLLVSKDVVRLYHNVYYNYLHFNYSWENFNFTTKGKFDTELTYDEFINLLNQE